MFLPSTPSTSSSRRVIRFIHAGLHWELRSIFFITARDFGYQVRKAVSRFINKTGIYGHLWKIHVKIALWIIDNFYYFLLPLGILLIKLLRRATETRLNSVSTVIYDWKRRRGSHRKPENFYYRSGFLNKHALSAGRSQSLLVGFVAV